MTQRSPLLIATLIFTLATAFIGCSNSYVDDVDRGSGYNYRPGYPEFRVAVTGQVTEENEPIIIVSGDLVYGSLIYTNSKEGYKANALIEITLQRQDGETYRTIRWDTTETIRTDDDAIVNSQEVLRFQKQFNVRPGDYLVQTVVTDKQSGKKTTRTSSTSIPDPEDPISHITEIRILGKNSDKQADSSSFNPATTYDIPSRLDSLKFVFQVTNNNSEDPLELQASLKRFRSDTSVARPMFFNNYSPSSISYKGIDYDEYEEIQTSTRTLSQPGSVVIEYVFTDLPRGNYRLEVKANEGTEDEIYKARDFSIKSPNYPSLSTPEELAQPLIYIMSEDEHEQLMSITDPAKMKKAIDRFWLSNIQNSNLARNVISLYYERVEEANKQFSNFKEGWKTDLGMVYILMGPPLYSDSFSDELFWSYSYNRSDPEKNFLFEQTKLKTKFYPFYNYLLQRSSNYFNVQSRFVDRWRSGSIMTYNL